MGLVAGGEKVQGQTLSHEGPEQAMTRFHRPSPDLQMISGPERYTQGTKGNAGHHPKIVPVSTHPRRHRCVGRHDFVRRASATAKEGLHTTPLKWPRRAVIEGHHQERN